MIIQQNKSQQKFRKRKINSLDQINERQKTEVDLKQEIDRHPSGSCEKERREKEKANDRKKRKRDRKWI